MLEDMNILLVVLLKYILMNKKIIVRHDNAKEK